MNDLIPDQCPDHEGGMDWPSVDIGSFVDSGECREVAPGTASKLVPL